MKKLLSIIATSILLPFTLLLTACGSNPPNEPHTHSWASTYTKTETEHYKTCSGCDETSERANHTGNPCTVCDYETHEHNYGSTYQKDATHHWQTCTHSGCSNTTQKETHNFNGDTCEDCGYKNLPTVATIRDLEVVVYQTENNGVYTIVKLPDGKNMLIDTGANYDSNNDGELDSLSDFNSLDAHLWYDHDIEKIDYFVLTNVLTERTGNVLWLPDVYEIENAYIPDTTGAGYTPSNVYNLGVNKLKSTTGCNVHTLTQTNQAEKDIINGFRYNGQDYEYTIDFITPLAPSSCSNQADAGIYVAIEYQDAVILLTGDATNANIDAYAGVEADPIADYDVDVLVTGYNGYGSQAITHSGGRGSDFLGDISLTSDDYVVITNLGVTTGISSLVSAIVAHAPNIPIKSTASSSISNVTIKINSQGAYTVTSDN